MMLINTRVEATIPVVIMGETGVGKTSLIRFLVDNILQEELFIFVIHAGIKSSQIIDTITTYNQKAIRNKRRIWIFLDEFNTCDAIGLLSEIICYHTLLGEELSDLLVFTAACNPYRLKNKKIYFDEDVGIRKEKLGSGRNTFRLLYTVHPLPETMLNYVWDFGELTYEDEKKYINTILEGSIDNYPINPDTIHLFASAVFESHKYFKSHEDMSSVSLRDVQRFKTIMEFFIKTLTDKVPISKYINDMEIPYRAGILALMHCYYLRLAQKKQRRQLLSKISLIIKRNPMRILEVFEEEQNDYLRRMEFPEEIAKNEALKENVFAMLVCIVNKIPILVCGKPGCSKTLAISLLMANLRGKQSIDPFFGKLPELTKVYFQGSSSCTSESIIKVFANAENYLKSKSSDELLPVVVFDEIGLAEISKHNPLKVLHERLERENIRVGFIGISNWRLDASKMNRALYLARPDPDLEDLQYTAECIYHSINQGKTKFHISIIQNLSRAYHNFKRELKGTRNEDVYGLRDFYHIIKMVSREFKNTVSTEEYDLLAIVKRGLERNFSGKSNIINIIVNIFINIHCCRESFSKLPNSRALELVESNLKDPNGRYLMVISNGDSGAYIIERFLRKQIIDNQVIIGSPFEEDIEKEEYGISCLSDIILYMEKGVSVILKGLEDIYSSLYDLFNQSFALSGGRRRCRIALGALYNPNCLVHEGFHCIVFMDKSMLDKQDPPFLNRFEKHFISFEDILSTPQLGIVEDLAIWIRQIITPTNTRMQSYLTTNHIFTNYNKDKLGLLVLKNSEMIGASHDDILNQCKKELISLATPDFLIISTLSGIKNEEWRELYELYCYTHTETFVSVIDDLLKTETTKKHVIIYTYSATLPGYPHSDQEDIKYANMMNYKHESDIKREMNEFFRSEACREHIFLIEIDLYSEYNHLSYFKYLVEKIEKMGNQERKNILIVVHMKRNYKYLNKYDIPLFEGWRQLFIENIELETNEIYFNPDIVNFTSSRALINQTYTYKLPIIISQILEKCFLKIKYDSNNNPKIFNHVRSMCEQIPLNMELVQILGEKIQKDIRFQPIKDWREELISNQEIFITSLSTYDAFMKAVFIPAEVALTKIIFTLEGKFAISSYFTTSESSDLCKNIWLNYFSSLRIDPNLRLHNITQSLITPISFDLKFPFSKYEFEKLQNLRKEYFAGGESEAQLIEDFKKITVLGDLYEHFKEAPISAHDIYFRDMIRQLFNDLFDEDYSFQCLSSFLTRCKVFNENRFEEGLIFLINKENLLINLVRLLKDCSIFFNYTIFNFLNVACALGGKEQFTAIEDYASHILNKILIIIFPKEDAFRITETFPNFKFKIEQIQNQIKKLVLDEGLNPDEDKLTRVDFWINFIELVNIVEETDEEKKNVLLDMAEKYTSFLQFNQFFYSSENYFHTFVDKYFESGLAKTPGACSNIDKLKAVKAMTLIKNSPPDGLVHIIEIDKSFLYNHLGSDFASFLMKKVNLINQIEHIINFEVEDFELNLDPEGYTDLIEVSILHLGTESHFAVYLYDYLYKTFHFQQINLQTALQNFYPKFKFWYRIYNSVERERIKDSPYIKTIISKMFISCYLEIYTRYICSNELNKNKSTITIIENLEGMYLMEGGHSTTNEEMRLFCINCIQVIKSLSPNEVYFYLQSVLEKHPWIKLIPMTPPTAPISILPVINNLDIESVVLEWLDLFTQILVYSNTPQLIAKADDLFQTNPGSNHRRLGFILALILTCAPLNSETSEGTKDLDNWVRNNNETLNTRYGIEIARLSISIIRNFPEHDFIKLRKSDTEAKTHEKLLMQIMIGITYAYSRSLNPISSLMFKDGIIGGEQNDISTIFNTKYPFGMKSDFFLEYLRTLVNLEGNFQYQLYSCSNACPFLYFIENCGQPWVRGSCPLCKSTIGGASHQLESRAGHRQIPKNTAKQYIRDKIAERAKQGKPGYANVAPPSDSQSSDTSRDLDPFTYRILHLILHLLLKYFCEREGNIVEIWKIITLGSLSGSMDPFGYLTRHIEQDFGLLTKMMDNTEGHVWLYKIFGHLPILLDTKCLFESLATPEIRTTFETTFDQDIIRPNRRSIGGSIREYKEYFDSFNKKAKLIGNYNPLTSEKNIFRYCKMGTQALCEMSYNLGGNKEKYPLLDIVFQKMDDLERIQGLLPIVNFTNYLIEKFSFRITREDARNKSIGFYLHEDSELKTLWDKFIDAWSRANFHEGVSYKCAHIKNTQFSLKSELIYFLTDTVERGNGLYMAGALYTLSLLHNNLINHFQQLFSLHKNVTQLKEDDILIPTQSISQKDCIQLPINIQNLPTEYSFNNIHNGREVIFDFERIENHLLHAFLGKRKLGGEDLHTMQYQFELLQLNSKHSSLIEEIRGNIKQMPLEREGRNMVSAYIEKVGGRRSIEGYCHMLKELLGSLEYILINLKNLHSSEVELNLLISQFVNQINKSNVSPYIYKRGSPISNIKICNIVDLYEIIEDAYFPYFKEFVGQAYRSKDDKRIVKQGLSNFEHFLDKFPKDPPNIVILGKVIQRFIMRCLIGEIQVDIPLQFYLKRGDFWPEIFEEDVVDEILDEFSGDIMVKHTMLVMNILERRSKKKEGAMDRLTRWVMGIKS